MDLTAFKKLPFEKKLIGSLFSLMLIVVFIPLVLVLVSRTQTLRSSAAPSSLLWLSTLTPKPGEHSTFVVAVNINTSTNAVIGTELYIKYDPTIVQAQRVDVGPFFPNPQVIEGDLGASSGTLIYTAFLDTGGTPQTGVGNIAQITFQAVKEGKADLTFDPQTVVAAVGEGGQNALFSSIGVSIDVQSGPQITPTNTPTPTPGLPTNTPTPTVSTPTNTPTSTPTPSATPTPTAAPTNTPTPTGTGGPLTPTPTVAGGTPTPTGTSNARADINRDSRVDINDYNILWINFGRNPLLNPNADINQDGKVNLLDYVILYENYQG